MRECPTCKGDGEIVKAHPRYPNDPQEDLTVRCYDCRGTGQTECALSTCNRLSQVTAWVYVEGGRETEAELLDLCATHYLDARDAGDVISLYVPREGTKHWLVHMTRLALEAIHAHEDRPTNVDDYKRGLDQTQKLKVVGNG